MVSLHRILSISLLAFSFYCVWCWNSFHFREFNVLLKQTDVFLSLKVFFHLHTRPGNSAKQLTRPKTVCYGQRRRKSYFYAALMGSVQEHDRTVHSHKTNYISSNCVLDIKFLFFPCSPCTSDM